MLNVFRIEITTENDEVVFTEANVHEGTPAAVEERARKIDTTMINRSVFTAMVQELEAFVIVPEEETQGAI